MNKFQNFKTAVVVAMASNMVFFTVWPVSAMVGVTYSVVNRHIDNHNTRHNVSDPIDRAYADDVREHVALASWVDDKTIILLRDHTCESWDLNPDRTWENLYSGIAKAVGEGPAFPYIAYKAVQTKCPQYADKFPADFDPMEG